MPWRAGPPAPARRGRRARPSGRRSRPTPVRWSRSRAAPGDEVLLGAALLAHFASRRRGLHRRRTSRSPTTRWSRSTGSDPTRGRWTPTTSAASAPSRWPACRASATARARGRLLGRRAGRRPGGAAATTCWRIDASATAVERPVRADRGHRSRRGPARRRTRRMARRPVRPGLDLGGGLLPEPAPARRGGRAQPGVAHLGRAPAAVPLAAPARGLAARRAGRARRLPRRTGRGAGRAPGSRLPAARPGTTSMSTPDGAGRGHPGPRRGAAPAGLPRLGRRRRGRAGARRTPTSSAGCSSCSTRAATRRPRRSRPTRPSHGVAVQAGCVGAARVGRGRGRGRLGGHRWLPAGCGWPTPTRTATVPAALAASARSRFGERRATTSWWAPCDPCPET